MVSCTRGQMGAPSVMSFMLRVVDRIRLSEESEMDGVGGSMRSFVDRRRRHAIERGDFGQRRAKWREYRKKKKKTSRCTGLFGCCHRKRKEQDREVSVSDDKTVEPSQDVDRSEAVIDLESGTKGGSDFDRPGYDVTWKHVRCQAPSGSPGQEILTNQHGEAKPNEVERQGATCVHGTFLLLCAVLICLVTRSWPLWGRRALVARRC